MKPFDSHDQDALRAAMMKTATGPGFPTNLPAGYGGKGSIRQDQAADAARANIAGALAYVTAHGDCRSTDVATHLRIGVGAAQVALRHLVEAGKIRRHRNEAWAKDTWVYSPAEAQRPVAKPAISLPKLPWEART